MTRQQKERIHYLFLRFMGDEASTGERKELSELLKEETDPAAWEELLEEIYQAETATQEYNETEWHPVLEQLLAQNRENDAAVKPLNKRITLTFRQMAVAASILLVIGLSSYFLFINKPTKQDDIVVAEIKDVKAPTTNRAMITLADGRTVYLDSAANGQIFTQNNIKVTKTADGKIIYDLVIPTKEGSQGAPAFNTLTNPRGSKVIDMTLSDGTHVWLNAGSSVTYPVAFIGNERKVAITGEAYFEITHTVTASGAKQPFIVSKGDMQVQVLGTHFNVNAYDDESDIKVTLLEGSVKVIASAAKQTVLKPGEQAVLTRNSQLTTHNSVDLDAVMAWKNGLFQFNNADLPTVLRQLARWYDVEVVYEGKIPQREFGGKMQRDLNLTEVLKILETNNVNFKIEGRTLIVKL